MSNTINLQNIEVEKMVNKKILKGIVLVFVVIIILMFFQHLRYGEADLTYNIFYQLERLR